MGKSLSYKILESHYEGDEIKKGGEIPLKMWISEPQIEVMPILTNMASGSTSGRGYSLISNGPPLLKFNYI
jgi:hypothetical protein